MRRVPLALIVPMLLVACSQGGTQDEEPAAAATDEVAQALETYSPATFDTIAWSTDTAQTNRGAVVWTFSCRKCHGDTGLGDANYVLAGDTLTPPSFATPGWRFATDKTELVKYIYAGNANGMPHWGVQGLKPRDIDAVSAYIQKLLVPTPKQPA